MEINSLEKHLEIWKRILFINMGASITLLATGIAELPNISKPYFLGWYGVWFIAQLASLLPGFVLLWGKRWMQIPLRQRLNTIFGYFIVAWITLLPVGIRMGLNTSGMFKFLFPGCAIAIAIGYWRLQRKSIDAQSEMFP